MIRLARRSSLALVPFVLLAGCSSGSGGSGSSENTGRATLAVTNVPSGVQCIEVSVQGASTVTQTFTVSGGESSANLSLGDLPLGWASVTGQAYDVACGNIGSAQPAWVADNQFVTLRAGEITNLTLAFREVLPTSGTANFVGTATAMAVGSRTTFVLLADGSTSYAGFIPNGFRTALVPIPTFFPTATLLGTDGAGDPTLCELGSDSTTRCWITQGNQAMTVLLPSAPKQLAVGADHGCALVQEVPSSSRVMQAECWGSNGAGQLGNGTTTSTTYDYNAHTIAVVAAIGTFSQLAAGGSTSCGLGNAGDTYCWGSNASGQVGDGTTTNRLTPTRVSNITGISQVSVGAAHSCALRSDGAVFCWGANENGELGNGSLTPSSTPVQVSGISSATQIVALATSSCALLANGTVSCWGDNSSGQLGNGTGQRSAIPVTVKGLAGIQWLPASAGGASGLCASNAQDVWCWGSNTSAQLANGTFNDAFEPVPMSGL